jgi:hypothetical protein
VTSFSFDINIEYHVFNFIGEVPVLQGGGGIAVSDMYSISTLAIGRKVSLKIAEPSSE